MPDFSVSDFASTTGFSFGPFLEYATSSVLKTMIGTGYAVLYYWSDWIVACLVIGSFLYLLYIGVGIYIGRYFG